MCEPLASCPRSAAIAVVLLASGCLASWSAWAECPEGSVAFCKKTFAPDTKELRCYDGRGRRAPVMDLGPVACLPELESLSLVSGEIEFVQTLPLDDLGPLQQLTHLRVLEVGHSSVGDISPLAHLWALEELSLHATAAHDISALVALVKLRDVDLSCTEVTDIGALSGLSELAHLDLTNAPVKSLSPLIGLKKLAYLGLSDDQQSAHRDEIDALLGELPELRVAPGRTW